MAKTKKNQTSDETPASPEASPVAYPTQEETVSAGESKPYVEKFTPDETKLLVDKLLFYKMWKSAVQGHTSEGFAAVSKFGALLGAATQVDAKAEWDKAQKFLSEVKHG